MLANLCVPPAFVPVCEAVGLTPSRPVAPAEVKRLGVHVQVLTHRVTRSARAAELKRVCAGHICILYRSSCAADGAACTYEEWPIARAAVRNATLVPLQEIRLQASNARFRRTAERALQLVSEDRQGRTFIPLARLAPHP